MWRKGETVSRKQSPDKGPVFLTNIGVCVCVCVCVCVVVCMYVRKHVGKAMCIHVLMLVCVNV
jgi:hypothetical protein